MFDGYLCRLSTLLHQELKIFVMIDEDTILGVGTEYCDRGEEIK